MYLFQYLLFPVIVSVTFINAINAFTFIGYRYRHRRNSNSIKLQFLEKEITIIKMNLSKSNPKGLLLEIS